MAEWREQGLETRLAFNISAHQSSSGSISPTWSSGCAGRSEVPTDRLVLELTEGATQQFVKLMDTLTRFRIKGIGLAIDDFGTGYSSLLQLRQLPFTEVKIDRCFVVDLPSAHDSRLIVKTIIELAHGLGLVATAEGVETVEQLRLVRELGCDVVQGIPDRAAARTGRTHQLEGGLQAALARRCSATKASSYGATSKRMP